MRRARYRSWLPVFVAASFWAVGSSRVHAQIVSGSRSLGGYGAASSDSMAGMSSGSPMIPYAGSFGGFMPYRMAGGGGSGASFSTRGSSVMEPSRTPFSLAPMSGGMGPSVVPRTSSFELFRSPGGMGMGMGGDGLMTQPSLRTGGPSVLPPNFGYPFYQPPSLFGPAPSAAGMSM